MTDETKSRLILLIQERRNAARTQAGWYKVAYDEYRQLIDLLDIIVNAI